MHPYVRSGLMTVGVAGALALVAGGFLVAESGDVELPAAVDRIVPAEGSLVSPAAHVGADLADDHTGVLVVDGDEVPLHELDVVEPLGQVFFTPGPGKSLRAFAPGTHRISVVYWPKQQRRDDAGSFSWQFRVG